MHFQNFNKLAGIRQNDGIVVICNIAAYKILMSATLKFLPYEEMIPPDSTRLSFRPLTMEDAKPWEEFILSEEAMKYFTFPRKRAESVAWIERQLERYTLQKGGMMAVTDKKNGTFYGQCGLLLQELDGEEVMEVGYSFLPQHWGKGYATEAAASFYKHGFDLKISPFIVSVIHVENIPSQNVARRNGLTIWKTTKWKELPVEVWRIRETGKIPDS